MSKSFRPAVHSLRSALRQLLALSLVLAAAVGPTAPLFAQAVPAAPMMLHITILDGEDSLNNIRERTAREPIVQVEDENHKPVAGALLLFSIQNGGTGAGGTFNGLSTLSVTTDAEGKAVAHGLKPNGTEGSYTIAVTATLGALVATTVIHQSNAIGGAGGGGATPGAPVSPGIPGNPAVPGSPISPGVPGAPTTPVAPAAPGTPVTPSVPHTESPNPEAEVPHLSPRSAKASVISRKKSGSPEQSSSSQASSSASSLRPAATTQPPLLPAPAPSGRNPYDHNPEVRNLVAAESPNSVA